VDRGPGLDFQRIVTLGISEPLLQWKGIEATGKLAASPNTKVIVIGAGKERAATDSRPVTRIASAIRRLRTGAIWPRTRVNADRHRASRTRRT
jgi:hypothetical protein